MQNSLKHSPLVLILGQVGTGKTTLGRGLLSPWPNRLIVDPRNEHDGDFVFHSLYDLLEAFKDREPPSGSVVIRHLEDAEDYTGHLFRLIQEMAGWAIMVDECDEYCSPAGIDAEFKRLVNGRRHFGIPTVICAARRPAAIHRDLSALADTFMVLRTHERRDVEYIKWACGEAFATAARNLPNYQYLEAKFPSDAPDTLPESPPVETTT